MAIIPVATAAMTSPALGPLCGTMESIDADDRLEPPGGVFGRMLFRCSRNSAVIASSVSGRL